MPGVKLHHPDLRNCVYTLIHEGRPLTEPMTCPLCGEVHFHKTYHLTLDGNGDVTVSETVFSRLEEAGLDELVAKTEIKKPPPLIVGMQPQAENEKPKIIKRERKSR